MTTLTTKEFRIHNARQFLEQFSDATPDNMYVFIGKSTPWTVDASPPAITTNEYETYYQPWNTMLSMKKVSPNDVSFSASRFNWTVNTVYAQYSAEINFSTQQFYVLTDEYKVYKCISNNNGAQSTIKPTSTSTSIFKLGDNYQWKYMFTLDPASAVKFITTDHFPVKTLAADDGSSQWTVQNAAVSGGIHKFRITTAGSGYLTATGNVASATGTTVVFNVSASAIDTAYVNYSVYIVSGTGAGQIRQVTAYTGASRTATITPSWSTNPDASSVYIVSPGIVVNGDGSGFSGYSVVTSGTISDIIILNPGSGYSIVTASIIGNTGTGSVIKPEVSPPGGHGSNAVSELNAHNITMNVQLTGTESDTFPVGNDFRVVGILVNPTLAANTSTLATSTVYDMTTKINVGSVTGTFQIDETITGGTSSATATIVGIDGTELSVNNISKDFIAAETITGGTSSATATISTVVDPLISKYSGKILYVKNQLPINRSVDQTEDYRFTIKF